MSNNLIVERGTKYICEKGNCFMKGAGHCMGDNIIVGGTIQEFFNAFLRAFFEYYITEVNKILAIRDQRHMDAITRQLYEDAKIEFEPIYQTIIQNGLQIYVNNIIRHTNSFINITQSFIKALLSKDLIKKTPKSLKGSVMGDKGYQLIGDILANTTDLKKKVERVYKIFRDHVNVKYAQQVVLLNEIKFLLYYLKVKFQDRGFIRAALQFDRIEAIEEGDEEGDEEDDDEEPKEPQQTSSIGGSKIYKITFTKL
jgi:predicted transcriptional regulator